MSGVLRRYPVWSFIALTFGIAIVAGGLAFAIGGAQTFESARSLPLLLVTIWSPNIAAMLVARGEGNAHTLMRQFNLRGELGSWLLGILPLVVALALAARVGITEPLSVPTWGLLVTLNLAMGPMGEELGWRGFLLPRWLPKLGTLGAAFAVGVTWALWHLPLWWLPSPHRAIHFGVFFATVMCFSIVMTAIWLHARRALGPVILFHLSANVGVGWLEATNTMDASTAYAQGLPYYVGAAALSAAWLGYRSRSGCELAPPPPLVRAT